MKYFIVLFINILVACIYYALAIILVNKAPFIKVFINLFENPKIGVYIVTFILGVPLAILLK